MLCTKQLKPSSPRASLGVNAEVFDCSLMLHRESKLANTVLTLSDEEAVHCHTLQSGLSGTSRNLTMKPPGIKEMGQWCCQCHQWTVSLSPYIWLLFGSSTGGGCCLLVGRFYGEQSQGKVEEKEGDGEGRLVDQERGGRRRGRRGRRLHTLTSDLPQLGFFWCVALGNSS